MTHKRLKEEVFDLEWHNYDPVICGIFWKRFCDNCSEKCLQNRKIVKEKINNDAIE